MATKIEIIACENAPSLSPPFAFRMHHVVSVFECHLPSNWRVAGLSKLTICFGQQEYGFLSSVPQEFEVALKCGIYTIADFDWQEFLGSDIERQQRVVLDSIELAVLRVIELRQSDPSMILEIEHAAANTRECEFRLRLPQPILSISDKEFTVSAFRCLSPDVGESWHIEVSGRGSETKTGHWITEVPDFIDRRGQYCDAQIREGEYLVLDRMGAIVFSLRI